MRSDARLPSSLLPLLAPLLLLLLLAGCLSTPGGSASVAEPTPPPPAGPAPAAAASPAGPDREALIEEAVARSVDAYSQGLEAYRRDDRLAAEEWFDKALSALLDVDPALQGSQVLEAHYRDLMENIHELVDRWSAEGEPLRQQEPRPGSPVDRLEAVDAELIVTEPVPVPVHDPPLVRDITYDIPLEVNGRVQTFIELYQGSWRKQFLKGFRRSGRYLPMIRRIFAEEGVPLDLAHIPHVESAFNPRALSRVRAYGLWQFMAATGRNYGLKIDYWVDERADPEKATRAAAGYLKFLYGMFGDWNLAMASYNAGEYKVQRGLRRSGAKDFWALARTRYLRRETKNFVPAILAAIVIYKDPGKYGFDPAEVVGPWEFDRIDVDGPVDLMLMAECAGTDLLTMRALNPELRRNTVYPSASSYELRVPPGTGEAALERLVAIPPGERIRQVEHVLRRGETLSLLAQKYGTSVRAIQTANDIRDPRRVRAGSQLTIPLTDGVYAARWFTSTDVDARGLKVYTVRRGDNPYRIANRHRISMDQLLAWNGLTRRSVIHPGDRLLLEDPATTRTASAREGAAPPAPSRATSGAYVVGRGDTLSSIARRHAVDLQDLLAWNGLHERSIIRPGDRLALRAGSVAASPSLTAEAEERHAATGAAYEYVVRRGDSLSGIAARHGVVLGDLLAWNGLTRRSTIHPGQRLVVTAAPPPDEEPGEATVYVVRKGDTLYDISRAHSVTVNDLCRWNGISRRGVIRPGDRLTLYSR